MFKRAFIAFAVLGGLAYIGSGVSNTSAPEPVREVATTADASYFAQQYKANEVAAQVAFDKGDIKTRGQIANIRLDISNHAVIELKDGTFAGLQVKLKDTQKDRVADLNVGDFVEIKAERARFFGRIAFLENAVIIGK